MRTLYIRLIVSKYTACQLYYNKVPLEKFEFIALFLGQEDPPEKDRLPTPVFMGFLVASNGTESTCKAGDLCSILGLGRSPGGGDVNPLQYSCLENPHGQRSLADYSPWGCKESDMAEQLSIIQYNTIRYSGHHQGEN